MKIAVVGGGAAGLMASIIARKSGAEVTIYEKMNRVGKKILATGNGRCNYTNMNLSLNCYHGKNIRDAQKVLEIFDLEKTLNFFEDLGIYPYIDESGKVYPNSLQASSILDVLRYEVERLNIEELTDFEVRELRYDKGKFSIIGNSDIFYADRVILCTGGKASPQLGSNGEGYKIAQSLGHKLVEPFPALVQLKLNGKFFKKIAGIRFDAEVKAATDKKTIRVEDGEILFTEYGISGPPILQISRMAVEEMNKGESVYIEVDMFPNINKNNLYEILRDRFLKISYKNLEDGLIGFINKKLIPVVLNEAGFDKEFICKNLNKKQIYKIVNVLKEWRFEVVGHNTWQQAQVTAGGIDLSEVCPETLESRKVKGLYLAGELLDVDGDCGGFNLQWAWSSGYTAGYYSSK